MDSTTTESARQNPSLGPPPPGRSAFQKRTSGAVTHFGRPREFLGNRFVYALISQRARGLTIGIDLNPDKLCNFDCAYCDVDRVVSGRATTLDLDIMAAEFESLLTLAHQGRFRELQPFQTVPEELLALKAVTLSGEGEPTLSPQFTDVVREVAHVRSSGRFPFFKLVLITNATGLDLPQVRPGLDLLTGNDEIWAKLDAGSQEYMNIVNRTTVSLEKVLGNILLIGRMRPLVIQSLFPLLNGQEPPPEEIELYVKQLLQLKNAGARISMVQVYSAHRPSHQPRCAHLPLKSLSRIAHRVREKTGLVAEVF